MSSHGFTRKRTHHVIAALAIGGLFLTGCATTDATETAASTETTAAGSWPRTFENADGTTTEIPEQPEAIVSTSVSTTGTLLAIDAPVTGSGAGGNGQFFAQWADVAEERDIKNLWAAGAVDLEQVYAQTPDLIVVSASGQDSLADQVAELQEIAPTIVIDYGGQTWQELAIELGEATGLEAEATTAVDAFDEYVAAAATEIEVPAGQVNIISFNGAGADNPIARAGSAQAQLLTALGFDVEDPNVEWHTQANERADFVWPAYENLTELTANTTFILNQDNEGAQVFANDPVLANVPSVQDGQVYGLGTNSFRVDKYSATEIVDGIVMNFGK